MPTAEVNGQRLNYEDSGSGEPAVLFSHGFFMDHSMFDPQVDALADRWRCIRWDERGHGQTESTPDPFTYWDSGADAIGLLDHLGIEQAVLAGMSQGGFLSLRAALTAPGRVRALILIDTQDRPEDPEKIGGYNELIASFEAPGGPPQEVLDIIAGLILAPDFPDNAKWQERWRAIDHDVLRQIYTTLTTREDDVRERLGELRMPTLVIHGDADAAIELDRAEAVAAAIPNAELVVIPGAGHAANLTHPAAVNPHIERFLSKL
jgi:pimeloyl-ACP methyl ester carboxylesterase